VPELAIATLLAGAAGCGDDERTEQTSLGGTSAGSASGGTAGTTGTASGSTAADVTSSSGSATATAASEGSSGGPTGSTASTSTTAPTGTSAGSGTTEPGPRLDVQIDTESDTAGGTCAPAAHSPCDAVGGDPLQAIGLNCPGESALAVSAQLNTFAPGVGVLPGWGSSATYAAREGEAVLVLSTGDLAERTEVPSSLGDAGFHCNSYFQGGGSGNTAAFPPPITPRPAAGDCATNPAAVGTGDCSGTIEDQFEQSGFKYDYQEVRLTLQVPPDASSLSFDFAYLTKEYPIWAGRPYNDMFIAWLESSTWTGNVSFDQAGSPIALNAAFLEYYDDSGNLPEFAGTCMRYSAGTGWLTTTVDVPPGEEITLILALFDLDDVNWDSFVLVDNVRWGCDGVIGPGTEPAG